jgi:RNA polymerase sigma factor (TIGR02999 family)
MDTSHRQQEEISALLTAWNEGDPDAWNRLVPIVYEELRMRARSYLRKERKGHTLRTTALVHEAYIRLASQRKANAQNLSHFYAIASEMMRRVLVDHAKMHNREKRGGGEIEVVRFHSEFTIAIENSEVDLLRLDEALVRLAELDPQQARVVEIRYFGGCTIEETAETLGISVPTVNRDWAMAKAWLRRELTA